MITNFFVGFYGFQKEDFSIILSHDKCLLGYAFVIAEAGMIDREHLPVSYTLEETEMRSTMGRETPSVRTRFPSEKEALIGALRKAGGRKAEAAKILGVHRMTVRNRMKKYGIESEQIIRG